MLNEGSLKWRAWRDMCQRLINFIISGELKIWTSCFNSNDASATITSVDLTNDSCFWVNDPPFISTTTLHEPSANSFVHFSASFYQKLFLDNVTGVSHIWILSSLFCRWKERNTINVTAGICALDICAPIILTHRYLGHCNITYFSDWHELSLSSLEIQLVLVVCDVYIEILPTQVFIVRVLFWWLSIVFTLPTRRLLRPETVCEPAQVSGSACVSEPG